MCEINWEIIVSICGIIVNSILAWWIVSSIQKRQNNERVIKDHFIEEIKELRSNCRAFLSSIYKGEKKYHEIIPTLRLLGMKASHILTALSYGFNIDKDYLNSYIVEMNKVITDDENYIKCLNSSQQIELTQLSLDKLMKFHAAHQSKFNDLILTLNEAKYNNLWK